VATFLSPGMTFKTGGKIWAGPEDQKCAKSHFCGFMKGSMG